MNENDWAVQIIAEAIQKAIEHNQMPKCDYEGIVKSVNGNYCTVSLDGHDYSIKNGINVSFKVGDKALVHCINGNFNKKVIIAKM